MIKRFRVQNYKALKDVTLDLTPMHLLIGPNDSGKTSILEAMAALCRSVDHPLAQAFRGTWDGNRLVWERRPGLEVSFDVAAVWANVDFSYCLSCKFAETGTAVKIQAEKCSVGGQTSDWTQRDLIQTAVYRQSPQFTSLSQNDPHRIVFEALRGVRMARWNARLLAVPVAFNGSPLYGLDPLGFGLALCLDDIKGFDGRLYSKLEARFSDVFPQVTSIRLVRGPAYKAPPDAKDDVSTLQPSEGKGIHFELAGGYQIPASQASDGMLLVLAYLTMLHLPEPPRLLLVEEPENGIHPRRLEDVLKMLRGLITEHPQTQVVMTTHSPYLVDLFKPEEVTLCHKDDQGAVQVRRLSDSPTVKEQIKLFTLGEIWTSEGDAALANSGMVSQEARP